MTKYFKETTARKNWTCSGCNSVIGQGETYFRCETEILCPVCKEETEDQMKVQSDEWWSGLWAFANENIKEYAENYGRTSDYEQVLMADYERQNPRPRRFSEAKPLSEANIVFIAKKR